MKQKTRNYLKLSTVFFSFLLAMVFSFSISNTSEAATLGKVSGVTQTYGSYDTNYGKYFIDLRYNAVSGAYGYVAQISADNKNWSFVDETSKSTNFVIGQYTTLNAGSVYYVRIIPVFVYNGDLTYDSSDASDSLQVVTAPASISTVSQTGAKSNSLTASWTGAAGATGYDIYVKKYGDSSYTLNGSTTSTSYTLKKYKNKNVSSDSAYYVSVCATKTSNTGFKAIAVPSNGYPLCTLPKKTSKINGRDWKPGSSVLKISWSGSFVADGYEVQFYNSKNKSLKKADVKTNSYTLKKAPKNSFCSVKVRPYVKTSNGKKMYASWSKKTYFVSQANMSKKKYTIGNGRLTINWSKVKGASKYAIYAGKYSSKMKKVATVSSRQSSYTLTKIGGSTVSRYGIYYVKVVPQKKVGSKTYKGDYGYYYIVR